MESAVIGQVAAEVSSECGKIGLRATGSTLKFDGYYKVYGSEDGDKGKCFQSYTKERAVQ